MRLVLDTNTVISGLLWHGTPGKLIDAAHAKSTLFCTSALLLSELRGVLTREKFAKQLEARGLNAVEVFDGTVICNHWQRITCNLTPLLVSTPVTAHHVSCCAPGRRGTAIRWA